MSNTGYKPSAVERRAQEFLAKKLEEALDGRKTSGAVDWDRLARDAGLDTAGGDSDRQVAAMTPPDLRLCRRVPASAGVPVEAAELVHAVQLCYRKHWLEDDSIGWDELGDILSNALANAMGIEAFVAWQEEDSHE